MGTVEFNSACLYRYAVVDWETLVRNLQKDTGLARKGCEHSSKLCGCEAHRQTEYFRCAQSAGISWPSRCVATRSAQPGQAFETAIRVKSDESLTRKSAEMLAKKAVTLQSAYGGQENTLSSTLVEAQLNGFERVSHDWRSF